MYIGVVLFDTIQSVLHSILNLLADCFFPKFCVSCHKLGFFLCPLCLSKIKYLPVQFCPVCQKQSVDGLTHIGCQARTRLDGLISIVYYQEPVKSLIWQMKYARVLGLQDMILQIMQGFLLEEEDFFERSFAVTSVPLHFLKKNYRGFNQSDILGLSLAQVLGLSFIPGLLKRVSFTQSQTSLKKEERGRNVRRAFSIGQKNLSSKVIIVDDVWTTGATLRECGRILKENGAKEVWALTLAREDKRLS